MSGKVQVRVARPLAGEAQVEWNVAFGWLIELDIRRQQLEVELAERQAPADGDLQSLAGEWEDLNTERSRLQGECDRLVAARTVTIDVQVAGFGGQARYIQAMEEVTAWRRERQFENLTAADSTSMVKLDTGPLTRLQLMEYEFMMNCAAIEGAVCRDDDGRPVVSNLDWPADMRGWLEVPEDVVKALWKQVYLLNPSWRPPWQDFGLNLV